MAAQRMAVAIIHGEPEEFENEEHWFYFFDATEEEAQLVREACDSYTKRHDEAKASLHTAEELLQDYGATDEEDLRGAMTLSTVESTDLRGVLKGLL